MIFFLSENNGILYKRLKLLKKCFNRRKIYEGGRYIDTIYFF